MLRSSSSISSSERPRLRALALSVLGFCLALLAADLLVGRLFASPRRGEVPDPLTQYFEYGRSTEAKARRLIGPTAADDDPMARAGWYEEAVRGSPVRPNAPGELLVAAYGQSFTRNAMLAAMPHLPGAALRMVAGPSATLSHSYSLYLRDRGRHDADVIVLGILGSSFTKLESMTHMTWNFERPGLHAYPRYLLEDGALREVRPEIGTLAEMRVAMQEPDRWRRFVDQLARFDAYYDPRVFEPLLDGSTLVRLVRRGWGQRQLHAKVAALQSADGYHPRLVSLGRAILRDVAKRTREDGKRLVVVLIHDRGAEDHLYRALGPTLDELGVATLSTHAVVSASDPANFIADGHFTPANDALLGEALAGRITSGR